MSRLFASGGQSVGASASVLSMNIHGWFPLGLTSLILLSKGLSRVLSSTIIWKHQFFGAQPSLWSNSHTHNLTTGETIAATFVGQVMSLLFNTLCRFVIAFLPRSKHLLISWLQSLSTAILEPKNLKSAAMSSFPWSICYEVVGSDVMILAFWMLSFKPAFSLSSFTLVTLLPLLTQSFLLYLKSFWALVCGHALTVQSWNAVHHTGSLLSPGWGRGSATPGISFLAPEEPLSCACTLAFPPPGARGKWVQSGNRSLHTLDPQLVRGWHQASFTWTQHKRWRGGGAALCWSSLVTEGSRPPGLPARGQAALPTFADPSPRRRRGPSGIAQGGRPWPEAGPGCLEWKLDQEALVGAARQRPACSWWREKQGLRTPQSFTFIPKSATSTHGEGDSRSG